ncbi:MAG: NADH:ubiquinone reductase (Na(+)-transporting) subunit B [Verrucomicrobia bacterium]|mgnify:CR=1 FL=1|jgi:Na+-transporting NADH:ubiquinone oxidoreductase subunit B|nr:NADH:ubiquinone reductase (Na(+)-transporting) subunit B [Verrucomicrobiota bacterium]
MKFILNFHDKIRHLFEKGGTFEAVGPIFDAADAFTFTPSEQAHQGAHVRDAIDIKRVMVTVIYALLPCFLFGVWNAGNQYNTAHAIADAGLVQDIIRGLIIVMPLIMVSYAVGGFWEVLFSCIRKHPINEGLLVSGFLFPMILPPTIPLWQAAVGISFGIVIGKEIFGGTGMNVVNPALLSRAFIFFAYAKSMTGNVWVASAGDVAVDAVTGATPLGVLSALPEGVTVADAIANGQVSFTQMLIGNLPGSIGETSAIACLLGAAVLLATGVASWRIMVACVVGLLSTAALAKGFGSSPMSQIPIHYHLVAGGFAFGAVFMATDPVSAAATTAGKWIYGFLIGMLVIVVRVLNVGFPEGVMLSILFMNLMAPLIDSFVVDHHLRRRRKRA